MTSGHHPRVLILEDELTWQVLLKGFLEEICHVDTAGSLDEGRIKVATESYDLWTVDPHLDPGHPEDRNAYQLIRECPAHPPLIVVTWEGDHDATRIAFRDFSVTDHLRKDSLVKQPDGGRSEVQQAVRRALRFGKPRSRLCLSIGDEKITTRVEGACTIQPVDDPLVSRRARSLSELADRSAENVDAHLCYPDGMLWKRWRNEAKRIGQALFDELFAPGSQARKVLDSVPTSHDLQICCIGEVATLRIPIELLYHEEGQAEPYLALDLPIVRSLSNTGATKKADFFSFTRGLKETNEDLRIALVPSPTAYGLSLKAEIEHIQRAISELKKSYGIRCEVRQLESNGKLAALLKAYSPHILHYCGHGRFPVDRPEEAGVELSHWSGEDFLDIPKLAHLLESAPALQLVYLSCCFGSAAGLETQKKENDFRSMVEGVVRANVPAVLGFRWVVSDAGASSFACHFYRSLLTRFSPEIAVYEARRHVAELPPDENSGVRGRDDATWASAVLTVQKLPPLT